MIKYPSIYFKTQEFVDKNTYNKLGDSAIWCIDWRMIWTMDAIRTLYDKPIIINNWHIGKDREWSGIRYEGTPYYSRYSQHTYGRAIDFLVAGVDSAAVRKTIINNPHIEAFKYITTIEDFEGMSWVHIDCRLLVNGQNRFFIVKP
jgi:hypothetical protein